jgi:hypothetical protein
MAYYTLCFRVAGEKQHTEEALPKANRLDPRLRLPRFMEEVEAEG